MKKILYALGGLFLIVVLVVTYFTPNSIIKIISPKRYVFNCMIKTGNTIFKEYTGGKKDLPSGNSVLEIDVTNNENKVINLNLYRDKSRILIESPELLGLNFLGIKEGNILNYFQISGIYRNCLDVTSSGKKHFSIKEIKTGIVNTNEYTLKLNDILGHIDKNVVIKLHMDKKNRIVSIRLEYSDNQDNVLTEILLKNDKVLINNLEFLYFKRTQQDNFIVSIKSTGNHALKNYVFDDKTLIKVVSTYVLLAKINTSTQISSGNVHINADGSVMNQDILLSGDGNYKTSGNDKSLIETFNLSINNRKGQISKQKIKIKTGYRPIKTIPEHKYIEIWNLSANDICKIAGKSNFLF